MRTRKAVLGILVLAGVLAGCATTTVRQARILTGQVTDESGAPVGGNPVLLVARSLDLSAVRMQYDERGRREVQTITDAPGAVPDRVRSRQPGEQLLPVLLRCLGL